MDDSVQTKVIEIIRKICRTKKPISMATSINYDLRIDADDAGELMDAIWKEFKTDFQNFKFDQYFNDEGAFRIFSYTKTTKKNLTVHHLVDVVNKGVWFD